MDSHHSSRISVMISAPSLDTSINVSGVSKVVFQILQSLSDRVAFTHLLIGAPTSPSSARALDKLRQAFSVLTRITLNRYDIYHSNTALNTKSIVRDFVLCGIAKMRGKHVLLHLHGGFYLHQKPPAWLNTIVIALLAISDKTIMLSATEAGMLKARHPSAASKIGFVYNSIEIPKHLHRTTAIAGSRVVFAGRLVEEKGVRDFLELARHTQCRGITFHIFGNGPLIDLVKQEASNSDSLFYEGVFSISGAAEALQEFDILVLPSISGEGMPMVIVEAMACGVIPIATRLGSVPEIIDSGTRGYLIDPGDIELCAKYIGALTHDPKLLSTISDNARSFAVSNFDAAINTAKLFEIYRDISPGSSRLDHYQ